MMAEGKKLLDTITNIIRHFKGNGETVLHCDVERLRR